MITKQQALKALNDLIYADCNEIDGPYFIVQQYIEQQEEVASGAASLGGSGLAMLGSAVLGYAAF